MKTAMQLMLEDLELRYKVLYNAQMLQACGAIEGTIEYAESLIIKEKEQSINLIKQTCMFMGASIIDIEISKMEFEDIYNNYYNENK